MADSRNYRRSLGTHGEDMACRMLEEMGHVIIERNWRSGDDMVSNEAGTACDEDFFHNKWVNLVKLVNEVNGVKYLKVIVIVYN